LFWLWNMWKGVYIKVMIRFWKFYENHNFPLCQCLYFIVFNHIKTIHTGAGAQIMLWKRATLTQPEPHKIDWLINYLGFTSRFRIFHVYGDVTIAGEGLKNLGLSSALRAFEQGGIFIVPHLLWHGASVFPASSEGLPHLVASYDTRGCGGSILPRILSGSRTSSEYHDWGCRHSAKSALLEKLPFIWGHHLPFQLWYRFLTGPCRFSPEFLQRLTTCPSFALQPIRS
jgi:hypothetical protein